VLSESLTEDALSWLAQDPLTRFLLQAIAIIATARLVGLVMRRLGQPSVIAEIVAGILLGPSILGWLAPEVSAALFPPGSLGIVRAVSQLGLVLFMFLVGLELDARLMRGRARAAIAIAVGSFAVPFALGLGVAWGIRGEAPTTVSFAAFAVFVGVAMGLTGLPVIARILTDRNLLRTPLGTIAIAAAAASELVAWCVLAFLIAASRATGIEQGAITTGLAVGYVAVMLFVVRPLLRRVAARVSTPDSAGQNLVALVLIGVMASAWLTEWIGIHFLFGAFLFGVVMPKDGGFARALVEKLHDLVVVLLLPLFFAVSGIRTDFGLALGSEHLVTCAVIVVVACAGKIGGAVVSARATGSTWREAGAIGVLLNTRGLMGLIVLNVGLELGLITPVVFSMLVVAAVVSTLATAPVLAALYPPTVMARAAIDEPAPGPAAPQATYRVMACVSHAGSGPALITVADAIAGRDDAVMAVHLAPASEDVAPQIAEGGDVYPPALGPALERARVLGLAVRPLSFVSPAPADDIVRFADVRDVDLVLLGLHKPVLSQTLLGGTVHEVLLRAHAGVAVYVERGDRPLNRVLVPFQGSPHDRAALALAGRIQARTGATVTVLHVIKPGAGPTGMRHDFTEGHGSVVVETIEHRFPAIAALDRAPHHDLVVVGVGREWGLGTRPLGFGLAPERLIQECVTPLLVVRGAREDEPSAVRVATARIASEA
jgi:Kef-type K+ transport system membrane component KefB/nucleotide-binding universal stress UspA family protein